MKRSEILEIIQSKIVGDAESILTVVEAAGMRPPINFEAPDDVETSSAQVAWDEYKRFMTSKITEYCKWEPEDEEK